MKDKNAESEEIMINFNDERFRDNSAEVPKEIITIKKETKIRKSGDGIASNDDITSLKKYHLNIQGTESLFIRQIFQNKKSVEESSRVTKKVITKTEMKVEAYNSQSQKSGKSSRFTKITKTSTMPTNQKGINYKGKRDLRYYYHNNNF